MKIGDKVKLFYDGRPLTRIIHDGTGTMKNKMETLRYV